MIDTIQECIEISSALNLDENSKSTIESRFDAWAVEENKILTGGWKVPAQENESLIASLEAEGFYSAVGGSFRLYTGAIGFRVGSYWIESYGKANDKIKFSKMLSREEKESIYLQMAIASAKNEKESGYLAD